MGFFDQKRKYDDAGFDTGFIEPELTDVEEVEEVEAVKENVAAEAHSTKSAFQGTEIGAAASLELKVVRPERFEDSCDIADHLLAGRTVVLNMDFINKDVTRRLIDFLSGVAYSIHGRFQRVATGTYIITPRNVEVSEAVKNEDAREEESFEEEIEYTEQ